MAGLNETAIRDILKGRSRSPGVVTLEVLARMLNCTISQLTGNKDAPKPSSKTNCYDVIGAIEAAVKQQSLVWQHQRTALAKLLDG